MHAPSPGLRRLNVADTSSQSAPYAASGVLLTVFGYLAMIL
jgi:hypothetical protein